MIRSTCPVLLWPTPERPWRHADAIGHVYPLSGKGTSTLLDLRGGTRHESRVQVTFCERRTR